MTYRKKSSREAPPNNLLKELTNSISSSVFFWLLELESYKRYILQRALPQTGIPQRQEAGIVGDRTFDPEVSLLCAQDECVLQGTWCWLCAQTEGGEAQGLPKEGDGGFGIRGGPEESSVDSYSTYTERNQADLYWSCSSGARPIMKLVSMAKRSRVWVNHVYEILYS